MRVELCNNAEWLYLYGPLEEDVTREGRPLTLLLNCGGTMPTIQSSNTWRSRVSIAT